MVAVVLENIQKILTADCSLHPGQKIVAGVSGGPDSLALLEVLNLLGFEVVVAHFNHQLRPEAGEDAHFVREQAEARGFAFHIGTQDVHLLAVEEKLSIEEAARTARYQFLFQVASQENAAAVAVGHNADDQVETVLMHFLRGAGLSGLKGMRTCTLLPEWHGAIPLVRPLLKTWRTEIEAFCQLRGLQPRNDLTNLQTTFYRNRLRHELLPYLEQYNPNIRQVIWRMSSALSSDYDFLKGAVDDAWQTLMPSPSSSVLLPVDKLHQLPDSLQRGVLRRAASLYRPGLRDIDAQSIERALGFIHSPTATAQVDWIANLTLFIEGGNLLIIDRNNPASGIRDLPQWLGEQAALLLAPGQTTPGRVDLANGWYLQAEKLDRPAGEWWVSSPDANTAWINIQSSISGLSVRARQPGDRFQPFGLDGHSMKLSDFMINQGMPQRARRCWPLVCSNDRIVWIPGYRQAEFTRILPGDPLVIRLSLQKVGAVSG